MKTLLSSWAFWALASAAFAAMTAILAKLGVRDIDPDLATLVRTVVILVFAAVIVWGRGAMSGLDGLTPRAWFFLVASGLATGASWLAYFRALKLGDTARVAPLDKLSVVLVAIFAVIVLGERLSVLGWLAIAMIAGGTLILAAGA